jgi:hypothetical protein
MPGQRAISSSRLMLTLRRMKVSERLHDSIGSSAGTASGGVKAAARSRPRSLRARPV